MPRLPLPTALILAAGLSSRMGELKPVMDFGGKPVLAWLLESCRAAGLRDIRVVVGHRGDEVAGLARRLGALPVENPLYGGGMYTSVRAGAASLPDEARSFFLWPADIPLVRPLTLEILIRAWREGRGGILYPALLGENGHPPLIDIRHQQGILAWSGRDGLRGYLEQYPEDSLVLETPDQGMLRDLDTPADRDAALALAARRDIPTPRECRSLMKTYGVDPEREAHSLLVARLALSWVRRLNRREGVAPLDPGLTAAGGLLHDLVKGRPNHPQAGAQILMGLGFMPVAPLVADHADLAVPRGPVCERELVYFADKLAKGDRVVSLGERFAPRLARHAHQPEVLEAVKGRLERAQKVAARLAEALGEPVEIILEGNIAEEPDDLLAEAWPDR